MGIGKNIDAIKQRINRAALRSGRDPSEVKLVAVTKNVAVDKIQEAVDSGEYAFGENRVQELLTKHHALPREVEWHFIGHLQRNKVAKVVDVVKLIHSLDRWSLAKRIDGLAKRQNLTCDALVQVNVAGETSKFGLAPQEVEGFIREVRELTGVRVKGLMTIAPYTDNPERVRPVFRELRLISDRIRQTVKDVDMDYLSMGMTNDFTVAIEEGANIIRVGTAIFGAR
ncbi:MAG TPA: YggS family pyridoxal phosphate-dependent enzyme [Clostridia bacterium]|nr:YggS family pyridoxal phosphate-dependent enzyme [Clostridia bacterium]